MALPSGGGRLQETVMPHDPTVFRWTAQPRFLQLLTRWRWCCRELPALMQRLAEPALLVVDRPALARAFWQWAATLDAHAATEPLDPVDHAHFECGMLLAHLLAHRVVRLPDTAAEVAVCTDTAATLLAAWRNALGAPALPDLAPARSSARWFGYVENVREDPMVAVAFLDAFTGVEPVWQFPTMPAERPAKRRALQERHTAA